VLVCAGLFAWYVTTGRTSIKASAAAAAVATPTLYLSPNGSDSGACTDASPCRTVAHVYAVAAPGSTIQVNSGRYGDQTTPIGTKTLLFLGSGSPVFHSLHVSAANLTFDGVNIDARFAKRKALEVEPVRGFVFKNASIGNVTDDSGVLVGGSSVPGELLHPVFDHVAFHDVLVTNQYVHNECVYSQASGLTVLDSTFTDCATMDLFITRGDWWGQPHYGGVVLENNDFGASRLLNRACCHYYGLGINGSVIGTRDNWTVKNNHFVQAVNSGDTAKNGGVYCGNTGKPGAPWLTPCSGDGDTRDRDLDAANR
jgi:hypothetical protein